MAKLSHPHVVAVYDVEQLDEGPVLLVMEYVAGQTLQTWLRQEAGSWMEVLERFAEAGEGLAAAHEAGLLHRDFKPANVLVHERGGVKVGDFGVATACASHAPSRESNDESPERTRRGLVVGTPRYMAPEQHRGEFLTAAADQYAFCVALWEAFCGSAPFAGDAMDRDKSVGPPAWPREEIPRALVDAIRRGLSPSPEDRWASMGALLEALA